MDLRCSLFGHDFIDDDIEREHERRGREEITTLRQYQACRHCGTRRLVSEKRHVRAVDGAEEAHDAPKAPAQGERTAATAGTGASQSDGPGVERDGDEGVEVLQRGGQRGTRGDRPRRHSAGDSTTEDDIIEAPADRRSVATSEPPTSTPSVGEVVVDRDDRTLVCPSCGLRPPSDSSLREGDSCPACTAAYLAVDDR